jgi:hypothetical protein
MMLCLSWCEPRWVVPLPSLVGQFGELLRQGL